VLKQIADAGRKSGTPVTLCGELAGRTISAMALIGLGYRSISMSPAAIGPVKAMLRELPACELAAMLDELLARSDGNTDMRGLLEEFAGKHDIPL
jgi:phosphotransferase system enzyme I (PtsP)